MLSDEALGKIGIALADDIPTFNELTTHLTDLQTEEAKLTQTLEEQTARANKAEQRAVAMSEQILNLTAKIPVAANHAPLGEDEYTVAKSALENFYKKPEGKK